MKKPWIVRLGEILILTVLVIVSVTMCRRFFIEGKKIVEYAALSGQSILLDDLTWVEVKALIDDGYDGIIIPSGGTEQNGPHMVLGKHNYIVRDTAEAIAGRAGNLLVAPVIPYVPQGEDHMRFAGTVRISEDIYAAYLQEAAESLIAHGFKRIYFLGDSGSSQQGQSVAAGNLNKKWNSKGVRVLALSDYYFSNGQREALTADGYMQMDIGTHASVRDTSELLAVYPEGIRQNVLIEHKGRMPEASGVSGSPSFASEGTGQQMLELKVAAGVRQILADTHQNQQVKRPSRSPVLL